MTPVLFVCPAGRSLEVERVVLGFLHSHAKSAVEVIGIYPRSIQRSSSVNQEILRQAMRLAERIGTQQCAIVIDKEIQCDIQLIRRLHDDVQRKPHAALVDTTFKRGSSPFVARYLDGKGISRFAYSVSVAGNWMHARVDESHVRRWISQFDDLGHPWVGDNLLAMLDMTALHDLGSILYDSTVMRDDHLYCVLSDTKKIGKSAEIISSLLRKRFRTSTIANDPADLIEQKLGKPIHILEDGLFTGTEIVGVFESLLNNRAAVGKRNKVRPLSDPRQLHEQPILLHFSRACDYGVAILKAYMKHRRLDKVVLSLRDDRLVNVLTPNSESAITSFEPMVLWEHGLPSDAIVPFAFRDSRSWGGDARMKDARRFCEEVGGQLLVRYLQRQQKEAGWQMWADKKIAKCRLGMWGLGLTHAFEHSVPKSTLPLFWGEGAVSYRGKTMEWVPLFPNSA